MTTSLIGCHALVWTGVFDRAGVTESVTRTRQAGFDLIEFPLMEPDTFDVAAARKALAGTGLAASASLGLPAHADISGEDPEAVAAGRRMLTRALEVTAEIGGTHLCGVLYGAMRKHSAPITERGLANSIETLREIADRAESLGIELAIEVVNRYETNMINTGRQALRYLDAVDRRISVHLDTYHMNIEEPDLFQPFLDCRDRLGYVHIGESHRGYLGTGSVDFDSCFKSLSRIGYTGPIVFESFSSAVVSPSLSHTLGIWRNLWQDSDELAGHANRFIRGHLDATATIAQH
ncbi:MAG: D-psicose/D-tagatose/L-ribulose 3-epimerase [Pseudonocardiales bacterium]|jgi:D-psicose/D-tagatose/L-ribulose 3-epimerase|nr:D-psicose/D-tagatose/L-ribulose 3-epimerase [Pseudonocardiales bacterium]